MTAHDRQLAFADNIDAREAQLSKEYAQAVAWGQKLRSLINEAKGLQVAEAELPKVWETPDTWESVIGGLEDILGDTGLESLDVLAARELGK